MHSTTCRPARLSAATRSTAPANGVPPAPPARAVRIRHPSTSKTQPRASSRGAASVTAPPPVRRDPGAALGDGEGGHPGPFVEHRQHPADDVPRGPAARGDHRIDLFGRHDRSQQQFLVGQPAAETAPQFVDGHVVVARQGLLRPLGGHGLVEQVLVDRSRQRAEVAAEQVHDLVGHLGVPPAGHHVERRLGDDVLRERRDDDRPAQVLADPDRFLLDGGSSSGRRSSPSWRASVASTPPGMLWR